MEIQNSDDINATTALLQQLAKVNPGIVKGLAYDPQSKQPVSQMQDPGGPQVTSPQTIQGQNGETISVNKPASTNDGPSIPATLGKAGMDLTGTLFNILKAGAAHTKLGGLVNAVTSNLGQGIGQVAGDLTGDNSLAKKGFDMGNIYNTPNSFPVGESFNKPVQELSNTPGLMDLLKTQAGGTAALYGGVGAYRDVAPDMPSDTEHVIYRDKDGNVLPLNKKIADPLPNGSTYVNRQILSNGAKNKALSGEEFRNDQSSIGNASPGSVEAKDLLDLSSVVSKTQTFVKGMDQAIKNGDPNSLNSLALEAIDLLKQAEGQGVKVDQRSALNSIKTDAKGFLGIGEGQVFHPENIAATLQAIRALKDASEDRFNVLARQEQVPYSQRAVLLDSESPNNTAYNEIMDRRTSGPLSPQEIMTMQKQINSQQQTQGEGEGNIVKNTIQGGANSVLNQINPARNNYKQDTKTTKSKDGKISF